MSKESLLIAIGERLKTRRKELGLTQAQLSYSCETDPSYIRKVEAGKVNISINNLAEMVAALEMSLSDFFKGMEL